MGSPTVDEAYLAKFTFIENRYRLTSPDDLGALPGDMSLLFSGGTAAPALQEDWQEAIDLAWSGQVDAMQRLRKS